jgi:integrase
MRLTAAIIRTLTLPPGVTDKTFWDDDLPAFGLRLRAGGSRTWIVQYAIAGQTRRMVLGSIETLDPGKARNLARDLLARVRIGEDPARDKQIVREQARDTIGALLPRFLARQRTRLKPRSWIETNRHLTQHCRPLHPISIQALDRRAVATLLADIDSNSGPAAANRVRGSLSAFCTWAAREGYLETNPALYTNKAVESRPRDRVLANAELALIWNALGDDRYGAIIKLLILTGARREEIGALRWDEVDFNTGVIVLPPARTKNRREHIIPLSAEARAVLEAQSRTAPDGMVFGTGKSGHGFQDWSGCKRDLDQRIAAAGKTLAPWRVHDFRRVVSTVLHERLAVPPHVIELILGHHRATVATVYNKALHLDERRRALQRWTTYVMAVVTGKPQPTRVVKLRG